MEPTGNLPAYARAVIHWKITNFSPNLLQKRNLRFKKHDSKTFALTFSNGGAYNWTLSLIRKQTCVSMYLTSNDLDAESLVALNFKVGAESDGGEVVWLCEGVLEDWLAHNRLGRLFNYTELVQKYEMFGAISQELKLVLRLEVIARLNTAQALSVKILDHLETLLNNEHFGNFTMIASDGREFHVNRDLLAARSEVFEAMLTLNMLEKQTNQATFPDISGPALEEFLRFAYCGKLNGSKELADELLAAAEEYHFSDLKPLCEASLAQQIVLQNVVETLILADMYNACDLKKFCIEYIVWHRESMEESDDWRHVSDELFEEILDTLADTSNIQINSDM